MSTSWSAGRSRRVVGFYGRGFGETYGVDEDVAGRGQQCGGRIEGGVQARQGAAAPRPVRRLRTGDRRRSARPADPAVGVRRLSADGNVIRSRGLGSRKLESRHVPCRPLAWCCSPDHPGVSLRSVGRRPASQAAVRHLETAERPDGDPLRGSLDADRAPAAVVSRRLEEREARPHRVRAPLRAPDVQGLEERRARGAHLAHLVGRRPEQRVHHRRRDGVLGDGAGAVLPLALWLEADRMATLRIDEATRSRTSARS